MLESSISVIGSFSAAAGWPPPAPAAVVVCLDPNDYGPQPSIYNDIISHGGLSGPCLPARHSRSHSAPRAFPTGLRPLLASFFFLTELLLRSVSHTGLRIE